MWRSESKQLSLADELVAQRAGQNQRLAKIDALIDWCAVEQRLAGIYDRAEGRPAYRPLVMFKSLLLQQWYQLSDAELEEALADRLSFRRFAGIRLDEAVPDHTTLCRFRARLGGLAQALFAEVTGQLERKGLMLKRGTLIDATLVEAGVRPPRDARSHPGQGSALDPDAQWTKRGAKSHYGYKAHVGVDEGSNLIRKYAFTGAKVAESAKAGDLVCGDERAVYGDRAYHSIAFVQALAQGGIADGVMRKSWPANDPANALRNRALSPIRSAVERVFGLLKRSYAYRRVRYRGLARNAVQFALLCIAINLRHAQLLLAAA
jgi:IS5 family transposase